MDKRAVRIDLTPAQARIMAEKQAAAYLAQAVFQAVLDYALAEHGKCTVTRMELGSQDPHLILDDTPGGEGGSTV